MVLFKIKNLKIRFKTTTIATILMSIWLGVHFNLPLEYWIMVFFIYVGITLEKK